MRDCDTCEWYHEGLKLCTRTGIIGENKVRVYVAPHDVKDSGECETIYRQKIGDTDEHRTLVRPPHR